MTRRLKIPCQLSSTALGFESQICRWIRRSTGLGIPLILFKWRRRMIVGMKRIWLIWWILRKLLITNWQFRKRGIKSAFRAKMTFHSRNQKLKTTITKELDRWVFPHARQVCLRVMKKLWAIINRSTNWFEGKKTYWVGVWGRKGILLLWMRWISSTTKKVFLTDSSSKKW